MPEHQYDKDQALEAAEKHLARKMMGRLSILDKIPDGGYLSTAEPEDYRFTCVAADQPRLGAGHIIACGFQDNR